MANIREVVYRALVEKVGVDSDLMSRVNSAEPICISLSNGCEIFVELNEAEQILSVHCNLEMKDVRVLKRNSARFLEILLESDKIAVKFDGDALSIMALYAKDELTPSLDISGVLVSVNDLIGVTMEAA